MLGKYLFIALFFTPLIGRSQTFPVDTAGVLKYEEVVTSKLTLDQLYNNAKLFTIKEFNNPASVIQIDDPEKGKIVLKAIMKSNVQEGGILGFKFDIWTDFIFQIDVKHNKYRYVITNLVIDFSGDAVKEVLSGEELVLKAEKKVKAKYKVAVYKNVENSVSNDIQILIENLKHQMTNEDDF